jgi:hypothetical protein
VHHLADLLLLGAAERGGQRRAAVAEEEVPHHRALRPAGQRQPLRLAALEDHQLAKPGEPRRGGGHRHAPESVRGGDGRHPLRGGGPAREGTGEVEAAWFAQLPH